MSRIFSGLVFIPLFVGLVLYLPPIAYFAFIQIGVLLCCIEFFKMADSGGCSTEAFLGTAVAMMLSFSMGQSSYGFDFPILNPVLLITLSLFAIPLSYILRKKPIKNALLSISATFAGILLIGYLLGYQLLLRNIGKDGTTLIILLYLIIWTGDAAALYTGRLLGKHSFSPVISPKKTWEGSIGGFTASLAVAFVSAFWFIDFFTVTEAIVIAAIMNIVGQMGDLVESLFKRSSEIKDSSTLIPGHGGFLDRADSLLFAAPVLYYSYLYLIK